MQILEQNKELTKEEIYYLTKAQDIQKMTEAVDSTCDIIAWCLYTDANADGEETELFSMLTDDGVTYATNSATFIKAIRDMLDIFEPQEIRRLKIFTGTSKNNRTFVTCSYVRAAE